MKNIIMVDINKIKPYPNNPRVNATDVGAVLRSIREYGYRQPIVVDKNYVVIIGHTRLQALKALAYKEIPVVVEDSLSDEKVRQLRIIDNKVGELSEWESDKLTKELNDLVGENWYTGFTPDEVEFFIGGQTVNTLDIVEISDKKESDEVSSVKESDEENNIPVVTKEVIGKVEIEFDNVKQKNLFKTFLRQLNTIYPELNPSACFMKWIRERMTSNGKNN